MRIDIRWHGRGGQGAVTASEIVAAAAILEGRYALAFPEFGAERRGAPVRAYTRISDSPLVPRTPITEPHIVIVLDPSLLSRETIEGLRPGGVLVVNTRMDPEGVAKAVELDREARVAVVDATTIALETLGAPIVNTAILGALIRATGIVGMETVIKLVRERFKGRIGEANVEAVKKAYEATRVESVIPPQPA
ncbi:MAG: 2-oxoacid:acceptor oxidoreductase family protein [Desulfurococcales archaeon]|nr:2-oxoacid:acceptor oxidoreductase family protein [Desulfurococcales archaeon]